MFSPLEEVCAALVGPLWGCLEGLKTVWSRSAATRSHPPRVPHQNEAEFPPIEQHLVGMNPNPLCNVVYVCAVTHLDVCFVWASVCVCLRRQRQECVCVNCASLLCFTLMLVSETPDKRTSFCRHGDPSNYPGLSALTTVIANCSILKTLSK